MNKKRAFTIVEFVISIAIIGFLSTFISTSLINFKKNQALVMDTDLVVEVLRQARNQTLLSKDSSSYGVHLGQSSIILFKGIEFVSGSTNNQVFSMTSPNLSITWSLSGGGDNIIFNRLTGETEQNGIINLVFSGNQKKINIFKTGLVELD